MIQIYKSTGLYLGFIYNQNLFSRDGNYLGWVNGQNYVWDKNGNYAGQLKQYNGRYSIVKHIYDLSPVSKIPQPFPETPILPNPPPNLPEISLPVGEVDAFQ